jgi:UDP-3-O-[3-hydroxymyristoyl] glucosamine N-acyltransferase
VDDAYQAFSKILLEFNKEFFDKKGIEKYSYIDESATVGKDCYIAAFAYIGKNCRIGTNVKISPQG